MQTILELFGFGKKFFSKNKEKSKNWIKKIKELSILSNEANKLNKKISNLEFDILDTQKDFLYIKIGDLINILSSDEELSVKNILNKSKHIKELTNENTSIIEVFPVIENDHIVLCPDVENCSVHKDFKGNKIKIISIR